MGFEQTSTALVSQLEKTISQCAPLLPNQAGLIDEWAPGDRALVETVIHFVRALSPQILNGMPTQLSSDVVGNKLTHMIETLSHIRAFDPKGISGDANQFLVSKIRLLNEQYKQLTEALGPILSLHTYRSRDADLRESKSEATDLLEQINVLKSEADIALGAMRKAAAQLGTSKYSKLFLDEAKTYRRAAMGWFLGTLGLTLVGVYIVWKLFVEHPLVGASLSAILSSAGIKLFVIAAFFVLLSLFVKNYSAARHNFVINKHRALALQTFETFTEAAKGDTKDAILRAATDAIFSIQKTGYITKGPAPSGLSTVTELVHRGAKGASE